MAVYRGNVVYVAKTLSKYCPVSILLRYMHEAKLTPTSDLPLFSPLSKTKSGYMMRSSRLSYSRCREVFKEPLGVLGCDPKVYGLHSLRSGGITSVVNNDDSKIVSERLLKLHGRWKTDVAKDIYVKEADSSRLSVSLSLGLKCYVPLVEIQYFLYTISIKSCGWVRMRSSHTCGPVSFMDLSDENDLRSFERSELERNGLF